MTPPRLPATSVVPYMCGRTEPWSRCGGIPTAWRSGFFVCIWVRPGILKQRAAEIDKFGVLFAFLSARRYLPPDAGVSRTQARCIPDSGCPDNHTVHARQFCRREHMEGMGCSPPGAPTRISPFPSPHQSYPPVIRSHPRGHFLGSIMTSTHPSHPHTPARRFPLTTSPRRSCTGVSQGSSGVTLAGAGALQHDGRG